MDGLFNINYQRLCLYICKHGYSFIIVILLRL